MVLLTDSVEDNTCNHWEKVGDNGSVTERASLDEALQLAKGSSTAVNLVKEQQRRLTSELVLGGPTCR